jgi:hypothetical protein
VVIALDVENPNDSEIDRTRSLKRAQAARKRISATSRRVPSAERAKTAAFVLERTQGRETVNNRRTLILELFDFVF